MSADETPAAADAAALDACVRALVAPGGFSALLAARMPQLLQARETGLEVAWRRLALGLGHDAYEAGRLVEALWRGGDVAAARAQVPISRAMLADRAFVENGHPFHLEKIGQMLGDFLAVFDYEAGALADDDAALADLHPVVVAALYDALWRALTELDFARARRYALRYLAQTGHTPTSLHVIRYGLQATGFHVEAGAQARALPAAEGDALVELRRLAVAARSAAEAGDGAALSGALAQADESIDAATAGAAAADEAGAHALAELALVAAMTALAADDPAS
ncbi:MAG: hypothetical protein JNK46_09965, partial [Methylobacteriaceae bacterium]|nr:hypothetical protein [Methylobacteriaceae bacterium]